jgi:hypothetical protein
MTGAGAPLSLATTLTLLRIGTAYALFGLLKRIVPIASLARWAWVRAAPRGRTAGDLAVGAVGRIQRQLTRGAPSDCLQAALVLYRELSRAGADPRLVLGFARDSAALVGHAWVEVEGAPVGETVEDVARFSRTATFGPHGRRMVEGTTGVGPARAVASTSGDQ